MFIIFKEIIETICEIQSFLNVAWYTLIKLDKNIELCVAEKDKNKKVKMQVSIRQREGHLEINTGQLILSST